MVRMPTGPLRATPEDWREVREWYVDDDHDDEDEPIDDDPMAEAYDRAIAEVNDLYPHHFDHDRRQMDLYDGRIESNDINDPPF